MPTNMSEIKQLLADWYLLALDNAFFVGALVIAVWLLAAILYNFKILFLKKKQKAAELLHLEIQKKLTAVEQQNQQQEEKLKTDADQMEQDKQLIAEIQDKVAERNQIIVANIKSIASKFDLSEQLVDSDKSMKDEFIWQQQDNIIQQLSDRLAVAQQENFQASEKDSLISNLQNSLDMQIKQFAQLEQTIETQKLVQQEQQKEVQQQLANTLEKHQLDFTQLINAVQNRSVDLGVQQQTINIPEQSTQPEEQMPENIVEQQIVEFSAVEQVSTTEVDSSQEPSEILESAAEPENIFEQQEQEAPSVTNSIEPLDEPEIEPVSEQDNMVQDLLNIAEPAFSTETENETQQAQVNTPGDAKSSMNVAGKFKSLLGKVKKPETKAKAENSTEPLATDEAKLADVKDTKAESRNLSGKFKSLLGKAKKSSTKTEPEQKIEVFTAEDIEAPEAEQQIESFITDDFKEPEVDDVHVEPDYGASNFKMPGALTKLFKKVKK